MKLPAHSPHPPTEDSVAKRVTLLDAMRSRPLAAAASLMTLLFFTSCSLKQPHIEKQTYLLDVSRTAAGRATAHPASLQIRNVSITPPFDGRGFVHRTSNLAYSTDFYHEFLTPPATQIEAQLQSWLTASKVFRNVLPSRNATLATHALDIQITTLHADVRSPSAAQVIIEAQVLVTDQRPLPPVIAFRKSYHHQAPLADQRAETLMRGWSQSLAALFTALENDLASHHWP